MFFFRESGAEANDTSPLARNSRSFGSLVPIDVLAANHARVTPGWEAHGMMPSRQSDLSQCFPEIRDLMRQNALVWVRETLV